MSNSHKTIQKESLELAKNIRNAFSCVLENFDLEINRYKSLLQREKDSVDLLSLENQALKERLERLQEENERLRENILSLS